MEYTLTLEFTDRDTECVDMINTYLGACPLTSCEIEDEEDYTYKQTMFTYDAENNETKVIVYGLGFDRITFSCESAKEDADDEDEAGKIFQIATASFPEEDNMSQEGFIDRWKNEHPGCSVRSIVKWDYSDGSTGFMILYQKD